LGAAPNPLKRLKPFPTPLFPVEPAWQVMLDAPPTAPGAIAGERLYIPIATGELLALERETGLLVWTVPIKTIRAPLVAGDLIVVATEDGVLALDSETGDERWAVALSPASAAPILARGLVVIPTNDGQAVAVNAATGSVIWRQPLGGVTSHPAAVVPNGPIAFSLEARVVALQHDTGEQLWTRALPATLAAPAAARDIVLVGSTSNDLFALSATSGRDTWKWRVGGDVIGAATDGDVVYFVSLDNILRAVNRGNGNQRWKEVIPTRPAEPPIAFGGIVVLAGVAPRVDAFDGKTGTMQGTYAAPADLEGFPLIDRPLRPYQVGLITVSRNGQVTALRPVEMMMRDPLPVALTALPGRRVERERLGPEPDQIPNPKAQIPTKSQSPPKSQ
jgi:outer membrane protein assembly factor BamB